jgi:hypothetical protein
VTPAGLTGRNTAQSTGRSRRQVPDEIVEQRRAERGLEIALQPREHLFARSSSIDFRDECLLGGRQRGYGITPVHGAASGPIGAGPASQRSATPPRLATLVRNNAATDNDKAPTKKRLRQ